MPPIRPIQFSALKALDPLHQQPQRGEDDDDQADIEHVGHGPSSDCRNPGATPGHPGDYAVLPGERGDWRVHAAPMRAGRQTLTEPMQPGAPARVITVTCGYGQNPAGTAWRCWPGSWPRWRWPRSWSRSVAVFPTPTPPWP